MNAYRTALVSLLTILSGCTTNIQSNPARTATEEMLLSTASDRAAAKLAPYVPKYATVFIDSTNFEGTDSKYAIASIRSHLLQRGIHLVDDKKNATTIIEIRAGALSTDRKTFMIGIPSFNIPVPMASAPLTFPQVALYGYEEQKGVAKFAFAGYNAKTGRVVSVQDPQYGFAHNTKRTVLIFISWQDSDYVPDSVSEEAKEEEKRRNANPPSSEPHMEINTDALTAPDGSSGTSPNQSAPPPRNIMPPSTLR